MRLSVLTWIRPITGAVVFLSTAMSVSSWAKNQHAAENSAVVLELGRTHAPVVDARRPRAVVVPWWWCQKQQHGKFRKVQFGFTVAARSFPRAWEGEGEGSTVPVPGQHANLMHPPQCCGAEGLRWNMVGGTDLRVGAGAA